MAKLKTAVGSVRAKAGLPAKAGRRRPSHIAKDQYGSYQSVPTGNKAKKNNFNIANRKEIDIFDESDVRKRVAQVSYNLNVLRDPKNYDLIRKVKERLLDLGRTMFKSDPFWFSKNWKEFKHGRLSVDEIMKGRVA